MIFFTFTREMFLNSNMEYCDSLAECFSTAIRYSMRNSNGGHNYRYDVLKIHSTIFNFNFNNAKLEVNFNKIIFLELWKLLFLDIFHVDNSSLGHVMRIALFYHILISLFYFQLDKQTHIYRHVDKDSYGRFILALLLNHRTQSCHCSRPRWVHLPKGYICPGALATY